jgi:hypothetical protein
MIEEIKAGTGGLLRSCCQWIMPSSWANTANNKAESNKAKLSSAQQTL